MITGTTYLALGDSYTIGEGVALHDSFPYQLVQLLRDKRKDVYGPEIVAKTGWTTAELISHLDHIVLNHAYDFITLLIGVNNQYRGLDVKEYGIDLEDLVQKAVALVKNDASRVLVMSIPDWGKSPFAKGRDTGKIGEEIGKFNNINRRTAAKYGCSYVDITTDSQETTQHRSFFAADGLHPSAHAYKRWASLLAERLQGLF
jgi:lysophospholipase L1-like esterase